MSDKVVHLKQDSDAKVDRLFIWLYDAITEYGVEHDMTVAEIVGTLESVKLELYLSARENHEE